MNKKALTLGAPAHTAGAAVLRMAEEETIHIGHAIEVHLVKADDGRAVLSILAPRSLSIDSAKKLGLSFDKKACEYVSQKTT
ncbi:carbon storage regulator [Xanthomonas oryzae]|uniref:carbon storage regulator n=1 Tax=Xanthomonas oryzae TaxID=347 RepID=UPI0002EE31AC|nr:carbon storage regulator [Xanthomonas oryzae]